MKNLLLLPALIAGLGLIPAGRVTAQTFTTLHSFTGTRDPLYTNWDGASPNAGLILSGNTLYGTTSGGSSFNGSVFKVNTDGTGLTNLHTFAEGNYSSGYYINSDGVHPHARLLLSGNTLYGTANYGGSSGNGTVFAVNTDGTGFTNLHSFTATFTNSDGIYTNSDGVHPVAGLVSSGNTLYGTAADGGSSGNGTVFAVNTDGSGFTNLYSFTATPDPDYTNSDGANPIGGLILSGNILYGTARVGGSSGAGTVFAVNTDGSGFRNLHTFTGYSDGAGPFAGLVLSGNTLYGTAAGGGSSGYGTVFAANTNGTGFTTLHSFTAASDPDYTNSDGAFPHAELILSANTLYGTAPTGGSSGNGTVFAVNTDGTGFTNLHSFTAKFPHPPEFGFYTNSDGASPSGGLLLSGNTLYGTAVDGGSRNFGTLFKVNTDGTGFTNLHSFTAADLSVVLFDSDGAYPVAGLILSGNTLYGTTSAGGSSQYAPDFYYGTVFKVNTDGTDFTNLHSFADYPSSDGRNPYAGLLLSGNALYGTTYGGGSSFNGTVFKVNTDGTGFTNLHSFTAPGPSSTNSDGARPYAGLILSGNTLYGTAHEGGSLGNGTVFKVNTDGTGFTNLHSFNYSGGSYPYAGLILSGNILYGTAREGGSSGYGTVFAMHTNGTGFTNLHSFTERDPVTHINSDGYAPEAGLILSGNTLYGTASSGGSSANGTVFAVNTDGTGFTNLHSFAVSHYDSSQGAFINSDGANPIAGLILSGNTLYGTANRGGSSSIGTVFAVNTDGTGFTNLHSLSGGYWGINSDGFYPAAGLILSGNTLYGTASSGGSSRYGTVFSLALGSVSAPQLTMIRSVGNVVLTWPTDAAGFTLQSTTNLGSPAIWSTVSSGPVVVNGQNAVTNPVSGTQRFYRLSQ